jgi:hypothetical protein
MNCKNKQGDIKESFCKKESVKGKQGRLHILNMSNFSLFDSKLVQIY